MSILDEIKSDGLHTLGVLGAILGFVVLFFIWSIGTWLLILLLVLLAAGFIANKVIRN